MRRHGVTSAAVIIAAAVALAGCGESTAHSPARHHQRPVAMIPLTTAVVGQHAGWAVIRLAGSGGVASAFWQLLIRKASGGRWRLATPPGVADTGGLVVTGTPAGSLTAGFVPSELLRFTPLAITGDGGANWSQALLPAALAAEPGALAVLPDGRLLAVTPGSAEMSNPGTNSWSTLVTARSLAASPAGLACGLIGLTAASVSPSGAPLLVADCDRPGQAGVFARGANGWQPAGPALPASLAAQPVTVLRLIASAAGDAALLAIGAGRRQVLIPAWLTEHRTAWTLGRPLTMNGSRVESVSAGADGQWGLVLGGGRGVYLSAAAASSSWQALSLPPSTAILLPGAGRITALAPGDSSVTVWQLERAAQWQRIQVIGMPVISGGSS